MLRSLLVHMENKRTGIGGLRLCIACISIVVSLLGVEIGFRVYASISRNTVISYEYLHAKIMSQTHRNNDGSLRRQGGPTPHPFFGFVRDANTNDHVNKYGFYGDDPIQKRSPDTVIIAVLGGSVATNLSTTYKDVLIEEFKKYPKFINKRIVIVTLANPAYRQPQQLLVLSYFLSFGAHYDMIINLDGFNEVALPYSDNYTLGLYPFFPDWWIKNMQKKVNTARDGDIRQITELEKRQQQVLSVASHFPCNRSALCLYLWNAVDHAMANTAIKQRDAVTLRAARLDSTEYQFGMPRYADIYHLMNDSVMVWKNSSRQLYYLAKNNHALYMDFIQPNQYDVGSKSLSTEEKQVAYYSGTDKDHYAYKYRQAVELGYPMLKKEALQLTREGIPVYDLSMIFSKEQGTIYSDNCCHYNNRGNTLLARSIAEFVQKEYARFLYENTLH